MAAPRQIFWAFILKKLIDMGWEHFDIIPDVPNTIEDLTNAQLIVIGDQYTLDKNAYDAFITVLADALFAGVQNLKYHVDWVYETLNRLQSYSALLMNGQVLTGTNPDTYNTPPVDATELVTQLGTLIDDPYINELGTGKLTYGVNQMILYSKSDGTGDFAYYQAEVTA